MAFEVNEDDRELVALAATARGNAHAPISYYQVGAALRNVDGETWSGCNVENIILGLSSCAEVVAVHKGVSEGARRFDTVAVVTDSSPPAAPCGSCRQMLFSWGVSRVILANTHGEIRGVHLDDLLPMAFRLRPEDIRRG